MSDSSSSEGEEVEEALQRSVKHSKTEEHHDGGSSDANEDDQRNEQEPKTFKELVCAVYWNFGSYHYFTISIIVISAAKIGLQGVCDSLCEACERLDWKTPTKIQIAALPHALSGRDVIGLAETGSGKTAAFALPILQSLLETPQKLFGLILTPTRELAFQIAQQFEALGAGIGLIVGKYTNIA
ncbi:hypothetical protein COOONC_07075 [Cooperia oncophora]